jgi:nitrile hydratase
MERNNLLNIGFNFIARVRIGLTPFGFLTATCLVTPLVLEAGVTKITITSRVSAYDGKSFGSAGAYEKIKGIVFGEIDPKDPRNALITDIEFAPKSTSGRVEYRTNFTIVKPIDMSRGPGLMLYNVVNRGRHGGPGEFHAGAEPGDGFLYKLGHVLLLSGSQGDVELTTDDSDLDGIDLPVARNADGSFIRRPAVWNRFSGVSGNTQSLGTMRGTPVSLDTFRTKLISAVSETSAGIKSGVLTTAGSEWAFADCRTVPFPGTLDPKALDALIDKYERDVGPRNGARVVARAWVDPSYKQRLFQDATAAIGELGYGGAQGEHMVVVENTPHVHNLVGCTLCSCYPWSVLGLPPAWYKSAPYRLRAVIDPRGVLGEFGLELADETEIRVWDSTAEIRYLVLPERPAGSESLDEIELATLVTRDAMVGVAKVPSASKGAGA